MQCWRQLMTARLLRFNLKILIERDECTTREIRATDFALWPFELSWVSLGCVFSIMKLLSVFYAGAVKSHHTQPHTAGTHTPTQTHCDARCAWWEEKSVSCASCVLLLCSMWLISYRVWLNTQSPTACVYTTVHETRWLLLLCSVKRYPWRQVLGLGLSHDCRWYKWMHFEVWQLNIWCFILVFRKKTLLKKLGFVGTTKFGRWGTLTLPDPSR